ncbi:MAG: diphthine--ammonia ligase [Halobacteria archaeon]
MSETGGMKVCSLFSGGKDSTYSMYEAHKEHQVTDVVIVTAEEGSYMYHTQATDPAELAVKSLSWDVDLHHVEIEGKPDPDVEKRDEITPLKTKLQELDVDAVVSGAVESSYQKSRVDGTAEKLGLDSLAPLWHTDPEEKLREIVEDYVVMITAVAAGGLDESWLGRKIDGKAVDELLELNEEYGVHPMGEGGEYETLVVDGPHMDSSIELEYETHWDGVRGGIEVEEVNLV